MDTTSNYLTVMKTLHAGNGATGALTFTLDTPLTDIDGIRIIGLNGGAAGTGADANATSGFVAINELQIDAKAIPEPSVYALLGLWLVYRLRRLSA